MNFWRIISRSIRGFIVLVALGGAIHAHDFSGRYLMNKFCSRIHLRYFAGSTHRFRGPHPAVSGSHWLSTLDPTNPK